MVGDQVRSCRLHKSDHTSFIAPWCNNRGGKAVGLRRRGIKVQ
jgi:hypothetical protein